MSLIYYRRLLFIGGALLVCYGESFSWWVYSGYIFLLLAGFIQATYEEKTK